MVKKKIHTEILLRFPLREYEGKNIIGLLKRNNINIYIIKYNQNYFIQTRGSSNKVHIGT